MKYTVVFFSWSTVLLLVLLPLFALDGVACSCFPPENRSLCQLGDEANAGQTSNFMAIVELKDSTVTDGIATYSVEVLELLAGELPSVDIFLVRLDGATCGQYRFIESGAKGVLSGNLAGGVAYPSYCQLESSFFRMNIDTVFLPLYNATTGFFEQPFTLTEFRTDDCLNFSNSIEVLPTEEAFSLSYSSHSEALQLIALDPSIQSENLTVNIYTISGQHLLEASPSGPIDVSAMPPGIYAILIRNKQQAWSKAFVKPN